MQLKAVRVLKIDPEFKKVIPPLKKTEYEQLEANLKLDGCVNPIVTWNGFIVDGHNRYEICTRNNIPFFVLEKDFSCKAAALAWICSNQLGRRNISDEMRKYLIGKQYESEKLAASQRNAEGKNQFSSPTNDKPPQSVKTDRINTANRIAQENYISHGTVEKYASYTRALELIESKCPDIVPYLLSGQCKISHNSIIELSKLSDKEIAQVWSRIRSTEPSFARYSRTRKEIEEVHTDKNAPSIKDMPKFDPDAEITGLTLTIPSWSSSINRVRTKTDLNIISDQARTKLDQALCSLQSQITEMLLAIRGDSNGQS